MVVGAFPAVALCQQQVAAVVVVARKEMLLILAWVSVMPEMMMMKMPMPMIENIEEDRKQVMGQEWLSGVQLHAQVVQFVDR